MHPHSAIFGNPPLKSLHFPCLENSACQKNPPQRKKLLLGKYYFCMSFFVHDVFKASLGFS